MKHFKDRCEETAINGFNEIKESGKKIIEPVVFSLEETVSKVTTDDYSHEFMFTADFPSYKKEIGDTLMMSEPNPIGRDYMSDLKKTLCYLTFEGMDIIPDHRKPKDNRYSGSLIIKTKQ